jgi:hypothetical protein
MKLIELKFTGGGPWDGHELAGEQLPEESFDVAAGRYELRGTSPPVSAAYDRVVSYGWVPGVAPSDPDTR